MPKIPSILIQEVGLNFQKVFTAILNTKTP